jgi:cell division protein FtsB
MQVQIITPGPDGRTIVVGGQGPNATTLPRTRAEFDALVSRRAELQTQIEQLRENREKLTDAIDDMGDSPGRSAMQLRVREVDERTLRLDRELDAVNDQIAASPIVIRGQVVTTAPPRRDPMEEAFARNLVPLAGMFSTFLLLPLGIALARLLWKRGTAVAERPALNEQAMVARLEQLQTSMDAMALEVERISENQRYVTKLMGEKDRAALPR